MILRTMLQRLYASLISGPGLNARPHNSRQRVDLLELKHFKGQDPQSILASLLGQPAKTVDFPARAEVFQRPSYPESEWSDEQKSARTASDRQTKILTKLRDIAEDSTEYYNDHGEHALFLGFPLLSLPAAQERQGLKSGRILAPVVLVPVELRVRRGMNAGVSIEASGEGADLVIPNPALLAWLEQQTGESTDSLFADETGEDPWREIKEVVELAARAAGIEPVPAFDAQTLLQPVPRTEGLPAHPAILPSAVMGLFPLVNPGLLRDTKWMQENEASLLNPVKAFLSPDALLEPEESQLPEAKEWDHAAESGVERKHDFREELLVTQADPCQAAAVAHARLSSALVIHGPPGTGKSQTIANVIGDHLARGERVLFVCDKRTALDVVKYRLDSMELGSLCGVIHDPQRDRRELYLSLRQKLEDLAQDEALPDPERVLERTNQRLNDLHAELRGYFDRLHKLDKLGDSFHQLCGQWWQARQEGGADLPETDGLTVDDLHSHRTDGEEILRRGLNARWAENPYRDRLGMSLATWLASTPAEISSKLDSAAARAEALDGLFKEGLPILANEFPALEQAEARAALAGQFEQVYQRGLSELALKLVTHTQWQRFEEEAASLQAEAEMIGHSLDRELFLLIKGSVPGIGEVSQRLLALDNWLPLAGSWKRFFAFKAKKAASAALTPLALPLTPEATERAQAFYRGLKARYLWCDLRDRVIGQESSVLPTDEELLAFRDGLPEVVTVLKSLKQPVHATVVELVLSSLRDLQNRGGETLELIQLSVKRAAAIHELESALVLTGVLSSEAISELSADWRTNRPAGEFCRSLVAFFDTLEEAIRLTDRLVTLPVPLQKALTMAALQAMGWNEAEPALRASVLARKIRQRLQEDEELARVDTQRVEAAFSELQERTAEKCHLIRALVKYRWQKVWRDRLLAATGSRLNSQGAALRQRLYVRGQKAMKLRQMIAAGADVEGGDPLFDLCPVWMAGPATVAQIFPREALFDVVVFDEASQCRIEEALPVLLRAKRVVIAGDPKQLPPTRFFEQSLAESDDTGAETAEEVFQQQQSEAEDLLAAALNLNVQEAFLDVHYRSRNEALIGFSNDSFYSSRLQPIPGHPKNKALAAPIQLIRVDGLYKDRGNEAEAKKAAELVAELLDDKSPPSIGIACFNLNQRDLILDALEELAGKDSKFAGRLEIARKRRGSDSFEGLFVKNLENVQGDERDHIIISTTFGPDETGKFRRNFGALSRVGGERRLNVLVTRAREAIHLLTSIPKAEYMTPEQADSGQKLTGRHYLYSYLRYAECLGRIYEDWQKDFETAKGCPDAVCRVEDTGRKSMLVEALGSTLQTQHEIGSTVYWGTDGFCVDIALAHPELYADVTLGVLADFTRYQKTPDPIAWEQFRSAILCSQGWKLHRLWSPALFRDGAGQLKRVCEMHEKMASAPKTADTSDEPLS